MVPFASIGAVSLEARREDTAVFAELASRMPQYCNDAILARCSDPAGTLVAVLRACAARRRRGVPSHLVASRFLGAKALCALPVSQLSQAELSPTAAQLLVQILSSHLGERDGAWEIFESLAEGYDGTLSSLLEDAALIGS